MRDTFETGISHPFLVKKGASLIAFLPQSQQYLCMSNLRTRVAIISQIRK